MRSVCALLSVALSWESKLKQFPFCRMLKSLLGQCESSVLAVLKILGVLPLPLLSLAELALGCQPQQSSLWRFLPCSTHTLQSQPLSGLRGCRNVHSSGSWLVHLYFYTLPFLVKTKKNGCGTKSFSAFYPLVLPLPNCEASEANSI